MVKQLKRLFKRGDNVKVYSMQSFKGGGFLNGVDGVVSRDQMEGGSVLVSVMRVMRDTRGSANYIDPSYEVYPQQLRLLVRAEDMPELLLKTTYRYLDRVKEDDNARLRDLNEMEIRLAKEASKKK